MSIWDDFKRDFTNWTRPSIQQPRWIGQIVRGSFQPIKSGLEVVKSYWDTWHQVYKPEGKKCDCSCNKDESVSKVCSKRTGQE